MCHYFAPIEGKNCSRGKLKNVTFSSGFLLSVRTKQKLLRGCRPQMFCRELTTREKHYLLNVNVNSIRVVVLFSRTFLVLVEKCVF